MKYFLEMIVVAKKQGFIHYLEHKSGNKRVEPFHFFECAEKSKVFVFSKKNKETEHLQELIVDEEGNTVYMKLDAPFEVFSFEILGGCLTSPGPNEFPGYIWCVMAYEIEPKKFAYYALVSVNDQKLVMSTRTLDALCEAYINRLNDESQGEEKVDKLTVLISKTKGKYEHKIKKIIHIRPKKDQIKSNSETSNTIDWSHRWFVRGHWRVTEGLGKDREGNYCVEGFTWVKEHVKGPEGKPLVQEKVRFVK